MGLRRVLVPTASFAVFSLLSLAADLAPGCAQTAAVRRQSGIVQLIENRNGRVSCWGVVIRLGQKRFKQTIGLDEIEIREGKHGHDLKPMMEWKVGGNLRMLTIRFKKGMGDFGSGNSVEITVTRSAFSRPGRLINDRFRWVIGTDVL